MKTFSRIDERRRGKKHFHSINWKCFSLLAGYCAIKSFLSVYWCRLCALHKFPSSRELLFRLEWLQRSRGGSWSRKACYWMTEGFSSSNDSFQQQILHQQTRIICWVKPSVWRLWKNSHSQLSRLMRWVNSMNDKCFLLIIKIVFVYEKIKTLLRHDLFWLEVITTNFAT